MVSLIQAQTKFGTIFVTTMPNKVVQTTFIALQIDVPKGEGIEDVVSYDEAIQIKPKVYRLVMVQKKYSAKDNIIEVRVTGPCGICDITMEDLIKALTPPTLLSK